MSQSTNTPLAATVKVGDRLVISTPRSGTFTTPAVTEIIHPWDGGTLYVRDASNGVIVATADNLIAVHSPVAPEATPGTPEFRARVQSLRTERIASREAERRGEIAAMRARFIRSC